MNATGPTIVESRRLVLRRLSLEDAAFILELVNTEGFLRYVGDKGVRDLDGARRYLEDGPLASYDRSGLGLYRVELRESADAIGVCGLIQREELDGVDVGFAFLPRYHSRGYATEAAAAVLEHGRTTLGLQRVLAITTPDNHASIAVLERIGLRRERRLRLPGDDAELELFSAELNDSA